MVKYFLKLATPQLLGILIYTCLASAAFAEATVHIDNEFNKVYDEYKSAVAANDWQSALVAAKRSHKLGKALYPESDKIRISLARNVGVALRNLQRDQTSDQYFVESLRLAEAQHGEHAPELIDHLYNLGAARIGTFKKGKEMPKFYRALQISRANYGPQSI